MRLAVANGQRAPVILVDQGLADPFLGGDAVLDDYEAACRAGGQPLGLHNDHG
jgi:S-formylglutathione hydrolase FrmB